MKKTSLLLSLSALAVTASQGALAWTIGTTAPGRAAPETWDLYGTTGTTTFVQEGNGPTNPLPGDPNSPATNQLADDDFYFPGIYATVVDGGAYAPVGIVASAEAGIERAITNGDHTNRIHFNFDASHTVTDVFTFSFAMLDLNDNATGTGQYDFDLFLNGVNIGSASHTQATIGTQFDSNTFTLADVGGTAGATDDNYVELVSSNPGTAARWSNFDYFQLNYEPVPEPSTGLLALLGAGALAFRRRRRRR